MAQSKAVFAEVLPKSGQLYTQEAPELWYYTALGSSAAPGPAINQYVLCKPKLLPLKSITLEKLEKMQKEAQEVIKTAKDLQKDKSPQHQEHTSNKLDEIVEEPSELS